MVVFYLQHRARPAVLPTAQHPDLLRDMAPIPIHDSNYDVRFEGDPDKLRKLLREQNGDAGENTQSVASLLLGFLVRRRDLPGFRPLLHREGGELHARIKVRVPERVDNIMKACSIHI